MRKGEGDVWSWLCEWASSEAEGAGALSPITAQVSGRTRVSGSFSLLGFCSLYLKHSWLCDEVHSRINSLLPFANILIVCGFFCFVCQLVRNWVELSLNGSVP